MSHVPAISHFMYIRPYKCRCVREIESERVFGVHSLALYSLVSTLQCALSRSVSFAHTKEYDMIAGQREGDKKEDRRKGKNGRREKREDRDREGEGEREGEREREGSGCTHKKQKEEVGGCGGGHIHRNAMVHLCISKTRKLYIYIHIHICMHMYIYIHTHVYIYICRYACVGGWGKSAQVR